MSETGSARGVPPEDVLAVFEDRDDGSEPLTAPEIADVLNASRRTVFDRLDELREQGEVASKKVGARGRVWWIPENEPAPAEPLRRLVGMLDEDEAEAARERSEEWGEEFDRRMRPDVDGA